jgi:hypothetical protein
VSRSPAQAFSAEVGEEQLVVLRGQGDVERPDASWTKNPSGFAAHGRPTLAVLAQLGFLARRRQCLRAVAWPQHVERNEGEECSVRACREPLRVRSSSVRRRGSVITSDRQHVRLGNRFRRANWAPERVSPTTDASPGRRPLVRQPARAGSFLRRRMPPPEKNDAARREPSRRRGSSTGFQRVTPVFRGRSRGATFRTPRRAGRARISRGVCFSGDSSLLRW